ncbi:MAG: alpha-glucosidase, partial [Steroidobacteraceae bacterium]
MKSMFVALLGTLVATLALAQDRAVLTPPGNSPWWQNALIYEIYPRSFQDSNGDGTGDLSGITQRLDYLQTLGVDAIWITPFYPSPQVDFGYDIADYEAIDPQFGTLADFDRLISEAGKRHIRVLLDMVLNHTSNQHPWFIDAASSRTDPKHDWYVWNDGKLDATGQRVPPNNWRSIFGGSSWEWVPAVQQYYYHEFYIQQPDLNWRNPKVEQAMFAALQFWLDRGVAGFRLDAVTRLFEDIRLRDNPQVPGLDDLGRPKVKDLYTDNLPEVHDTMRRLRQMVDQYPGDRVLIGETYLPDTKALDQWYGGSRHDELQLPMDMQFGFINKLDAGTFRKRLEEIYTQVHGSEPMLVFDNHDNTRSWERYGDGVHDDQIARLLAALLLTSKATAVLYQGQELGMRTASPQRKEDVRDPVGISNWPTNKGRDGERTPMQWDSSNPQAGFTTNPMPWLPVQKDYHSINVSSELAVPDSLLNWYRTLIALRRTQPALREGSVVLLDRHNPNVLSYARIDTHGKAVLVALNMSATEQTAALDLRHTGISGEKLQTLLAAPAGMREVQSVQHVELPPFGSWVG